MINKEIEFLSNVIRNSLPNSNLLTGNEDAIAINSNKLTKNFLITNIDSISWHSDALTTFSFTYELFGKKIVSVTLSDICAKGATGKFFLNSISIPQNFSEENMNELIRGMRNACNEYSLEFLGGDLGTSEEVVLTGIIIGETDELLYRKNCQVGDTVWVTGTFGFTGLAFESTYSEILIPDSLRESITQKILNPKPKIKESQILKNYANSCIDSSDGLAISLYHLSNESGKTLVLDTLPIDPKIKLLMEKNSSYNAKNIVLYAGEEFELVFTLPPAKETTMLEEFQSNNLDLPIKIGKITDGKNIVLDNTETSTKELKILGWDSLRKIN
jgi:thiamine-monophosphate kinase